MSKIGESGVGQAGQRLDGEQDIQAALAAGDVDLVEELGGFVDDHLEAAVEQRQGRDAAGLQAGEALGFALGGQDQLLFADGFGQGFQVDFGRDRA